MRLLTVLFVTLAWALAAGGDEGSLSGMIDADLSTEVGSDLGQCAATECLICGSQVCESMVGESLACRGNVGGNAVCGCPLSAGSVPGCPVCPSDDEDALAWLDDVKVGYDRGFVIASQREVDLQAGSFPFLLRFNGWGQIRHSISDFEPPNEDINAFKLKRARVVFSGHAFTPDFTYFVQFDGRSSSGDNLRLLDYYVSYDVGHAQLGCKKGTFGIRTGKYKMPLTMSRWMSGREFEFTDRAVASIYFDANRSLAWGLYGKSERLGFPVHWETAIFNGLVTGGAETGSSGTLDDNFAYSARIYGYPIGQWGKGTLADFDGHDRLAMRCGCGFAGTTINRVGQTEFNSLRVVDSGNTLSSLLPASVDSYGVAIWSVDASFKFRGWSTTLEYYFRNVNDFQGASLPELHDNGFWFQLAYFLVPEKFQLMTRWSRVVGDSGTLGETTQSSDEVGAAFAWYFRGNHAKFVSDVTRLTGAPINSSALDITPGDRGWLFRSQLQFSF